MLCRHIARTVFMCLLTTWAARLTSAQGTIEFENFNVNLLDAPVTFADGSRVPGSAGFTAQLYGGPPGSPVDALIPLLPTARFRPEAPGYIVPVQILVLDRLPGSGIELVMRAYSGTTWETSPIRGESAPFEIRLGGGGGVPSALTVGIQPFSVFPVPEPGTLSFISFGAAALALSRAYIASVRSERTARDE